MCINYKQAKRLQKLQHFAFKDTFFHSKIVTARLVSIGTKENGVMSILFVVIVFLYDNVRFHPKEVGTNDSMILTSPIILLSDFHLSKFQRIVISSPMIPIDTISVRVMVSAEILPVNVRIVTRLIPPTTLEELGTIIAVGIIVDIFSTERLSVMFAADCPE